MPSTTVPATRTAPAPDTSDDSPWWRHAMVWVVIAGPLAVVLASFVTIGIAWRNIDPVISDASATGPQPGVPSGSAAPAQQARNHAATPQK